MNNKWVIYGGLVLLGVVLADRLRALPVINKLPSV